MKTPTNILLSIFVAVVSAVALFADDARPYSSLPKYQTPVPNTTKWYFTLNLGPTGARGYVDSKDGNTTACREIIIRSVEPGSPADGALREYDIILGVSLNSAGPVPFRSDARLTFARAITHAESDAGRGKLRLLRWRDGVTKPVTVELPVLGTYSKTAPFDCPKTEKVVRNAVEFLVKYMPPIGYGGWSHGGFPGVPGGLNGMLFLATGEPKYLDHARRTMRAIIRKEKLKDGSIWTMSYRNLFLCEYYLATGDKRALRAIENHTQAIIAGQADPAAWCHNSSPGRLPRGYGVMNQTGITAFMSLILADKCGVPVPKKVLVDCAKYFGQHVGIGGMPYGDHAPYNAAACNGKNGSTAVAFSLLKCDAASQWHGRLACSSNLRSFEIGHTGMFFNQTWTPLGAAQAGKANLQRFWSRFNSYRDLCRRWDGSFITQSHGEIGKYVSYGPIWSTAGYALGYCALNRRLAILGRKRSVFEKTVPEELKSALALYHQKKFEACRTRVKPLSSSGNSTVRMLAQQLHDAAGLNLKSIELTLADMKRRMSVGDIVVLRPQLDAIKSIMAETDPRLSSINRFVTSFSNTKIEEIGYGVRRVSGGAPRHCGLQGHSMFLPWPAVDKGKYEYLKRIARDNSAGVYQTIAREFVAKHSYHAGAAIHGRRPDVSLVTSNGWRLQTNTGGLGTRWTGSSFNHRSWKQGNLPYKQNGKDAVVAGRHEFTVEDPTRVKELTITYELRGTAIEVYINGTMTMRLPLPHHRTNHTTMKFKPVTRELLKKGKNVIAIRAIGDRRGLEFNCQLKALME